MSGQAPLVLTRYRDVREALNDSRLVIHKPLAVGNEADHVAASATGRRSHRVRPLWQALSQQLAPRVIERLAGFIETTVHRIVTDAEARGGMDVVRDLAFPLPVAVMAELLGLPQRDHSQLRPLFETITRGHDMGATQADRQHARFAQAALIRWLAPQLGEENRTPLLQAIRQVADAEGIERTLVDYWCMMLLYAGSATTRDLIANAIGLLLEHPAAVRELADGAPIEPAIEEMLRFDGPVRAIGRVAIEDLTIGEQPIARGDLIYLMLAEANRDPHHFPSPDRLDLARTPNPHLAFGMGVTHCLGAHLARLEARIVLTRLLRNLPHATAREPADWNPVRLLRQRNRLEISFGSRQQASAIAER